MWCLTTWLGHLGNHGILHKFVFIRKAFNLGMGNKPYCGYCWCVGNSVISQVAQPGGEAPHLEDKKIMFGKNQLLQVDFIQPSSTTDIITTMLIYENFIYIYIYMDHQHSFIRDEKHTLFRDFPWVTTSWLTVHFIRSLQTIIYIYIFI